jgi:hypothetical protein
MANTTPMTQNNETLIFSQTTQRWFRRPETLNVYVNWWDKYVRVEREILTK